MFCHRGTGEGERYALHGLILTCVPRKLTAVLALGFEGACPAQILFDNTGQIDNGEEAFTALETRIASDFITGKPRVESPGYRRPNGKSEPQRHNRHYIQHLHG
jgi:hypothetical protein